MYHHNTNSVKERGYTTFAYLKFTASVKRAGVIDGGRQAHLFYCRQSLTLKLDRVEGESRARFPSAISLRTHARTRSSADCAYRSTSRERC